MHWNGRDGEASKRNTGRISTPPTCVPDRVLGTLPVSEAARVCARGGRYLHLSIDIPAEARGRELSADDMQAFGAQLEEYFIWRVKVMAFIRRIFGYLRDLFLVTLGTLFLGVGVGMFADLISPVFGVGDGPVPSVLRILSFLLLALVLGICGLVLIRWGSFGNLLQSAAKKLDPDEPIHTVIIGLSPLDKKAGSLEAVKKMVAIYSLAELAQDVAGFGEWAKGKDPAPVTPPWQQAWRRIQAHRDTLREIIVVPSRETAREYNDFEETLRTLLNREPALSNVSIRCALPNSAYGLDPEARRRQGMYPDYTDYDQTHLALRRAIAQSQSKHRNICIDYTSGMASFSVAAAAITVNTQVRIGYVETRMEVYESEKEDAATRISGGRAVLYKFGIALPGQQ